MRSEMLWSWTLIGLGVLAGGCSDPGQDSHTEVFQTPQQAALERHTLQRQGWQATAQALLHEERPGVEVKGQGNDELLLEADGLSQTISLVNCYESLAAQPDRERALLRQYLLERLRPFELARLKSLGFERLKPHLLPVLLNGPQLEDLRKTYPAQTPTSPRLIFTNLYCLSVVKWDEFAMIPVNPALLGLDVEQEKIDDAAMENLRQLYLALPQPRLAVTDFGPVGKSGQLGAAAPAASILLPEFAADATKVLAAQGDLVVIAPTPMQVNVVRRQDDALVEPMVSLARTLAARAAQPLCDRAMLLDEHGLSPLIYTPATKPAATLPAATQPVKKKHAYIVN